MSAVDRVSGGRRRGGAGLRGLVGWVQESTGWEPHTLPASWWGQHCRRCPAGQTLKGPRGRLGEGGMVSLGEGPLHLAVLPAPHGRRAAAGGVGRQAGSRCALAEEVRGHLGTNAAGGWSLTGGAAAFPGDSAEEKGLFQRPREKPVRREARRGMRRRSGGGRGKAVSCVWCMTQEGLRFAAVYRSGRAFLVCARVHTPPPSPAPPTERGHPPAHRHPREEPEAGGAAPEKPQGRPAAVPAQQGGRDALQHRLQPPEEHLNPDLRSQ